jgi:putative SOS response-associated peptidase YedK
MCGRYGRFSRKERIEQLLGTAIAGGDGLDQRYNVCPSTEEWVLKAEAAGVLCFERYEWGLLPAWAKSAKAARQVNARAETVSLTFLTTGPTIATALLISSREAPSFSLQ